MRVRQGFINCKTLMIISSSSFNRPGEDIAIYKKVNLCFKECNILKIVHNTSDNCDVCSITAYYSWICASNSRWEWIVHNRTMTILHCSYKAKLNIMEWGWILSCDLLCRLFHMFSREQFVSNAAYHQWRF